jgi:hypothetical protein
MTEQNADYVPEAVSWSAPDGWRHALSAETPSDPTSLCGQAKYGGQWAMHVAQPSCPECLAILRERAQIDSSEAE